MRRLALIAATSITLVVTGLAAPPAGAAPGDLDTAFGGGTGKVALEWSLGPVGNTRAIASTADGRVLLAGDNGAVGCLTRLTAQGVRDTSFAATGSTPGALCDFASGANGRISNVTVTPSGSVLLAFLEATGRRVVKLSSAGAISFNVSLGPALGAGAEVLDVTELSDGRVAVLESTGSFYASGRQVTVLTSSGAFEDDWSAPPVSGWSFWPDRLLPTAGAGIVLAGLGEAPGTRRVLAQRLTSAGAPVPSYGTSGIALGPVGSDILTAATTYGGGIVLAFNSARTLRVARFDAAGRPVAGFGTSGIATLTLPGSGEAYVAGAVVAKDGRASVLVNGLTSADAVMVARFTAGGSADASFGTGGVATWAAPGSETRVPGSIALGPFGDLYTHSDNSTGGEELLRFDGTTDSSAPTVAMTRPTLRWTLSTRVPVSWSASDPSGVVSSDLRVRRATAGSGLPGAYTTALSATASRTTTISATAGTTVCSGARARDVWGFTSTWTPDRCTALPLAPRQLSRTAAVTSVKATGSYTGRALLATKRGAAVSKASVTTKRIALVVTKCPTCGSVAVFLGKKRLATVSLAAPTLRRKQVVPIATFGSVRTGTVRIVVTSTDRRVLIEGLGVSPA